VKTLAERVDAIIDDSLFRAVETATGVPDDAVIVKGILHDYAFHPQRVAGHRADIAALCDELAPQFHKSHGGGWSFLNLCVDKYGDQWGDHINCEALLCLAMATQQGGYLMPRDMWSALPGGLPYVWLGE
jgi:hypothetical protein